MSTTASGKYRFDEKGSVALVLEWQKTKQDRLLEEIFKKVDCMSRALIFSRGVYQYVEVAEMLSMIQVKIWKGLKHFDPARGRLYSFFTRTIHNRITQAQLETCRRPKNSSFDAPGVENAIHSIEHPDTDETGMEDMTHKIMQTTTTVTDLKELEAQRWLVLSFIDSSFTIRRHSAANAMTAVYGIERARSRELHDLTLLEVRRTIMGLTVPPKVSIDKLCGTRQKALKKYRLDLSATEFSELVFLMRNLSSSIISDINHILYGFPGSRLLF